MCLPHSILEGRRHKCRLVRLYIKPHSHPGTVELVHGLGLERRGRQVRGCKGFRGIGHVKAVNGVTPLLVDKQQRGVKGAAHAEVAAVNSTPNREGRPSVPA